MDISSIVTTLSSINPAAAGLGIMLALAGFVFYKAHNDVSSFNLKDMFIDPDTKLMSLTRFSQFIALAISSWGFIHLVLGNALTETYLSIYMGVYAVSGSASKFIAAYRNKGVDTQPDVVDNKG